MLRALKYRTAIAVITSFLLVSLNYEIKIYLQSRHIAFQWWGWLIWLVSFVMSLFFATSGTAWAWNVVVRFRWIRRKILGKAWIEGTWFLQTDSYDGAGCRTTVQVGLAEFSYSVPDLSLEVSVPSAVLDCGEPVQTESISVSLDDGLRYMHRFVRHTKNVQAAGAAYGIFISHRNRPPTRYEGGVIFLDAAEQSKLRQTGIKLSESDVREIAGGGPDWQQAALHDGSWIARFHRNYQTVTISKDTPSS